MQKLLLFLALVFSLVAPAAPKAYFKQRRTIFQPTIVVVDGVEYSPKSYFSHRIEIADAMKQNPQAYEAALSHQEYMTRSSWLAWGGLGLALTYLFLSKPTNQTIYWSIFGTGFVSGLYYQGQGYEKLNMAVNLYNKDF